MGGRGDAAGFSRRESTPTPTPANAWNRPSIHNGGEVVRQTRGASTRRHDNGPAGPHNPADWSGAQAASDNARRGWWVASSFKFHNPLLRVIGKRSVAGWREKSRPLSCKDRWRPPASLPCGVCCRSVAEGGGVRDLREADDDSARAGACGAERSQPARAARPRTSTAFEFRAAGLDFVTGAGESFSNEMAGARLEKGGMDCRGLYFSLRPRAGDNVAVRRGLMRVRGAFARGGPWSRFYFEGGR